VFFLRNPHECTKIFTKEKLPILPVMNIMANIPEMRMQPRYNSYSDFMAIAGYYDLENLFTVTLSWKTLFDIYKPDLIVCDHSPICCLAAFGRIPVVLIGDGFTLPPAHEPVFPIVSGTSTIVDSDRLLENMRIVQKMHGQKMPQTITEPFRTAARLGLGDKAGFSALHSERDRLPELLPLIGNFETILPLEISTQAPV